MTSNQITCPTTWLLFSMSGVYLCLAFVNAFRTNSKIETMYDLRIDLIYETGLFVNVTIDLLWL